MADHEAHEHQQRPGHLLNSVVRKRMYERTYAPAFVQMHLHACTDITERQSLHVRGKRQLHIDIISGRRYVETLAQTLVHAHFDSYIKSFQCYQRGCVAIEDGKGKKGYTAIPFDTKGNPFRCGKHGYLAVEDGEGKTQIQR